MTFAASLAVMASLLALFAAAMSNRLSVAPGWRDQRLFSYVALSAAAYAALGVPTGLGVASPWVPASERLQVLALALHLVAWLRYANARLEQSPPRCWERWCERALLAGGVFGLVPGIAFHDQLRARAFRPLGLAYIEAMPTAFGTFLSAAFLAVFALLALRFLRAWRRSVPWAAAHSAGLCMVLLAGVNDLWAFSSSVELPHLLELGLVFPLGAVAHSITARFAADARDLARLRLKLETLVAERTRELACAVDSLHRAENLVALGRFATGVAHEVNNPIAVVTGNLQYLAEALDRSARLPDSARECISDSLAATGRVARVVRQLRDAGRLAASNVSSQSILVASVVRDSLRLAASRCGGRVRFESFVAQDLSVLAQEDALVEVLVNLLVNAGEAIPANRDDGRVLVRGERGNGLVRIAVEDNGTGIGPEVLCRVFEPFFTTKPFGSGGGLGLALSRGLIAGLGGDLRLESRAGVGTRAVVELPEGAGTAYPAR